MIPLRIDKYQISDFDLYRIASIQKVEKILSFNQKMMRTASVSSEQLVGLFMQMIQALNIKSSESDVADFISKVSIVQSEGINKQAKHNKTSQEKNDVIHIVSKKVKDSHYQIDISKDSIVRNGKKLIMVSCYAKDDYLSGYLIKRNFLYSPEREKQANEAYDEILTKIGAIKERYYNEVIETPSIFAQIRQTLDGVISEIKMEEDSLATNINRKSK